MSDVRAPTDTAGVIAPPPLIALATLVIGVVGDWLLPLNALASVLNWPARIGIGAALLLAGGALVVVGEQAFKQVGTNVKPWRPSLALATTGIYAHLRNPMYVGAILILTGLAAALASDWMAIMLLRRRCCSISAWSAARSAISTPSSARTIGATRRACRATAGRAEAGSLCALGAEPV